MKKGTADHLCRWFLSFRWIRIKSNIGRSLYQVTVLQSTLYLYLQFCFYNKYRKWKVLKKVLTGPQDHILYSLPANSCFCDKILSFGGQEWWLMRYLIVHSFMKQPESDRPSQDIGWIQKDLIVYEKMSYSFSWHTNYLFRFRLWKC